MQEQDGRPRPLYDPPILHGTGGLPDQLTEIVSGKRKIIVTGSQNTPTCVADNIIEHKVMYVRLQLPEPITNYPAAIEMEPLLNPPAACLPGQEKGSHRIQF